MLAGVAAAASVFPATSGGRPADAVPLLSLVVLLGLAAAVMGRAWVHRPALRVVVVVVAVWLGCALVPGPARLTALLLSVKAVTGKPIHYASTGEAGWAGRCSRPAPPTAARGCPSPPRPP